MPVCRICRDAEADSFEHTPPQKAFNDGEPYTLMDYLGRDPEDKIPGGRVEPRGSGAPVLCEPCNNKTGSWYGAELVNFARAGAKALADAPRDEFDALLEHRWAHLGIVQAEGAKQGPYPLRFAKGIVTMLATAEDLGVAHPELRALVLDRKRSGLADNFRLYLALFAGPYARQTGLVHSLTLDGRMSTFAEVAFPPFAYVLTVDTADAFVETCDITSFAHTGYDDRMTCEVDLLIAFGHTGFPCDYRTKAMLERYRDLR
jgi:hypothetical protein